MKNKKNISRNNSICELYKSGKSLRSVGKVYGISYERVRQILETNHIERHHGTKVVRKCKATNCPKSFTVYDNKTTTHRSYCSRTCVGVHSKERSGAHTSEGREARRVKHLKEKHLLYKTPEGKAYLTAIKNKYLERKRLGLVTPRVKKVYSPRLNHKSQYAVE